MKNRTVIGTAIAALGCVPMAMAEFEIAFDMAGTTVENGDFVFGKTDNYADYAGRSILRIGVRDLVVNFNAPSDIQFTWAVDLSGYGPDIYIFEQLGPFSVSSQETLSFEFDISGWDPVVAPSEHFGDWNMGTFVSTNGVDNGLTVNSGEGYYVLEGDEVPAATVVPLPTDAWMGLALLGGIAGYGFVRRRI